MQYKFCENDNFEDYASGRVLYSGKGIPNFLVRLLNEMFGRALAYSDKKEALTLYDPLCGGGYALTILGLFHSDIIKKIYGSDIDEAMVVHAGRNLALLEKGGLKQRKLELEKLYAEYGKASHREAMESADRLMAQLKKPVAAEVFCQDCTKKMPAISPDIIITDIPYGNLVEWKGEGMPLQELLEQLAAISTEKTILVLGMDKKQRVEGKHWVRLEKQLVGKRKFEIFFLGYNKRL